MLHGASAVQCVAHRREPVKHTETHVYTRLVSLWADLDTGSGAAHQLPQEP